MNKQKINETVLVIDDDNDLIHLLEMVLHPEGYQIIRANNGRDGVKMASATNPDLILLDLHMPIMNGLEALDALRQNGNNTPVIFMTTFSSVAMAVKAFRLGVHHYLPKPFDLKEARESVTEALRETRLKREGEALQRNLIAADAVRQTVVTLAHHINNQLMIMQGSLSQQAEVLAQEDDLPQQTELMTMIANSQQGVLRITAVLKVLQQITNVEPVTYFDSTQMLDIDAAVEQALSEMSAGANGQQLSVGKSALI